MDKFVSQTETSLKKKKRRWTPKGRQVEDKYLDEVSKLFSGLIFKRDELIEYLHILQDKFGVLYDKHLVALSTIINLPLSEIYEVATFYAHFNIVKDSKDYNPVNVVRVCESLTCELFGAHKLLQDIKKLENKNIKVVPGPCMGRCNVAPTVCVEKIMLMWLILIKLKKQLMKKILIPSFQII